MILSPSEYAVIILAYFIGSVPFGLLLGKVAGLGDITTQGSGNIGATNMVRVGGKKLGLLTLLLDAGKGVFAVLLAAQFFSEIVVVLAAAASVVGHVFPVWLKFRGGKGVATTLAVLCAVCWPIGVLACIIWAATFFFTRISSLSALVSMATMPFVAFVIATPPVALLAAFLALLVIARHHQNIRRLLNGTEKSSKTKK